MNEPNNPAGRLVRLIKKANSHDRFKQIEALDGWSELLGIEKSDQPNLLFSIGVALRLPEEIKNQIQQIPNLRHQRFLTWYEGVLNNYSQQALSGKFWNFFNPFSAETISILEICDELLEKEIKEGTVSIESIHELLDKVRELRESLESSNLPQHLREYIRKNLDLVEQAILNFRLQGYEALEVGLERSVGVFHLRRNDAEEVASTPLGKKLFYILGLYVAIVTAVNESLSLAERFQNLLPEVSPDAEQTPADVGSSESR